MKKEAKNKKFKQKYNAGENISGWLFISIAMLVFVIFTLYPVISAIITSFQKYKPFGSEWVGFRITQKP